MTRLHAQTPAIPATPEITDRLEALRSALRAENISMGELIELEDLQDYIPEGDVELLEAAGVPEFPEDGEDGAGFDGYDDEPECNHSECSPHWCNLPTGD